MAARVYNCVDSAQDLYDLIPSDGQYNLVTKDASGTDVQFQLWQYTASSSAADNFAGGVIKPTLQTGNGRHLRKGYYSPSSLPITISTPSVGNSITSGVAFQPRSGGACLISVQASLTGLLNVTGQVIISMSATSGGTYINVVGPIRLLLAVLGITADADSGAVPVPAGWWVKVTYTGTGTATLGYTRWDV